MNLLLGRKIVITRFAEVFLNFAEAFDCGNHQILPKPLEHCGVRGKAHDFMIY